MTQQERASLGGGAVPPPEPGTPGAGRLAALRRLELLRSSDAASRFTVMAIRCAAMALNLVVQLVMARVMGLSAFGSANTALALLNILVVPATLGYETAAIRYVALVRDDQPLLRALTVRFVRTVALGSLVTCSFVAAGALVEFAVGHSNPAIGLAMLVVIIPGFALVRLGEAWLRGFGCLTRALISSGVLIPVLSILLILGQSFLLGFGDEVGVGGALGARAVATGIAVIVVGAFVWGKLKGHLNPRRQVEDSMLAEIHRTALVLCGVALLAIAVSQMDIVAVSFMKGSAQAGVYSAASRVAQAMNIALVAVNFVLAPHIARLFADGNREQLQHDVSSAATWSASLMACACAVLIPASSLVLSVFGPGFGGASDALRVLMLGQLANAICGPTAAILYMTGMQWQAMRVLAVAAVIDIVLFALLIPPFGLTGAACATAICTVVWNIGMLLYARSQLRIWSLPGPLAGLLP